MVRTTLVYEGDLRCALRHEPSNAIIKTDAPVDNQGKGEAFSPTDLVAAAVGSCMMTLMGIAANKYYIDLKNTFISIEKGMSTTPFRRISLLDVLVHMALGIPLDKRTLLESAANNCPVLKSLHPDIKVVVEFIYL